LESGGVQQTLGSICEAFCNDPWKNDVFVTEVIKASPEMLKRSPLQFGDFIASLRTVDAIHQPHTIDTFLSLSKEDRQMIIDYSTWGLERNYRTPTMWYE
jgi:Catalase